MDIYGSHEREHLIKIFTCDGSQPYCELDHRPPIPLLLAMRESFKTSLEKVMVYLLPRMSQMLTARVGEIEDSSSGV